MNTYYYYIKVRVQQNPDIWEFGRSTGGQPYSYLTEELAVNAARLWGDAYTRGDVRIVVLKKQ